MNIFKRTSRPERVARILETIRAETTGEKDYTKANMLLFEACMIAADNDAPSALGLYDSITNNPNWWWLMKKASLPE